MIYFIIPTINGEISGEPYILTDEDLLKSIKDEVTIYAIEMSHIGYFIKEIGY